MGLIVGVLAKLIMPGKDPGGIIITTLIGVAGCNCRRVYRFYSGVWDSYRIQYGKYFGGYWWRCPPIDSVSPCKEIAPS